ncbi:MAG TPA: hypothetical protein VGC13_30455 [Longimicrobium sp.]|jgi:hypothetical protein|uniref:hypothetical protein n=1 Tax=Longimicrobium sp. TaxID=2029185 RepID=UPI002ED9AC3C
MNIARILGAAAALSLIAGPAQAQSLLSARGLGLPLEPVDARARGLGGLTVGLPDAQMSLVNPAAAVGLPAAGLTVTFQADEISSQAGDQADDFTTARFPVVQAAFPLGQRVVGTLGYASVLDQNWSATRNDSIEITGTRVAVVDRFRSNGGVARLRAGAGYRLLPRLDVGAAVDIYSGAVRDSVFRIFQSSTLGSSVVGTTYEWQGLGFSAGARWRGDAFSVSAVVSGGGNLTAEPQDSGVVARDYSLPLQVDAGASARIAQQAMVAVSARWAGWGSVGEDLAVGPGDQARDAAQVTAGVEFEGLRFLGRPVPLRAGGRLSQLPFRWEDGAEFVDERAATAGLGVIFGGGAASLDLSGERGWRGGDAAGIEESFWRVSLSLSLLGR